MLVFCVVGWVCGVCFVGLVLWVLGVWAVLDLLCGLGGDFRVGIFVYSRFGAVVLVWVVVG